MFDLEIMKKKKYYCIRYFTPMGDSTALGFIKLDGGKHMRFIPSNDCLFNTKKEALKCLDTYEYVDKVYFYEIVEVYV